MTFMSIDQSLSCSGVMIWNTAGVTHHTVIKTPTTLSVAERIIVVLKAITSLVDEYHVSHIVIESLPYGLNSTSVRPLAGLYYCINILCITLGITFSEANVTAVKKFATGSGKAKKPDMIAAAQKAAPALFRRIELQGIKKTTGLADLADAYFIGAYFGHKSKTNDK